MWPSEIHCAISAVAPVALDEVEDKEALHAASSPDDRIGQLTTRNPFIELTGRSAAAAAETHSDLRFGPVFVELAAPVRPSTPAAMHVRMVRTGVQDVPPRFVACLLVEQHFGGNPCPARA